MRLRRTLLAAGAAVLLASGCGSGEPVSSGSPEALSAEAWCDEYRDLFTGSGMDGFFGPPDDSVPFERPSSDEMQAAFGDLKDLAGRAPREVRDDLQTLWSFPAGGPSPAPADLPDPAEVLEEPLTRASDWLTEHCGMDEMAGEPEMPEATGEWQAVQSGQAGGAHWTLYRTGATDDGVCLSFESDPPYADSDSRLQVGLPPGVQAPPELPPDPIGFPTYKGKEFSCGPPADLFRRSSPVDFRFQDAHDTNAYNVIAGTVVPDASSLTVTFDDGTEAVVRPVDGTFVVTYASALRVARVVPDLGERHDVVCDPLEDPAPDGMDPGLAILSCHGEVNRASG